MGLTKNTTDLARAEVGKARDLLARWEAEQGTAQAELADLQRRAGDEALDDPEAAGRLPRQMQELRDRIEVAGQAVEKAGGRVTVAERAFLVADADSREPVVLAAREALQAFDVTTARLVEELRKHTGGEFVSKPHLDVFVHGPQTIIDKRAPLERALADVERPVAVLRALAAGEDPGHGGFPDTVWGPGAVVPARDYLASIERQAQAAHRNRLAREQLAERIERVERGDLTYDESREAATGVPGLLVDLREQLANLDAALDQASA